MFKSGNVSFFFRPIKKKNKSYELRQKNYMLSNVLLLIKLIISYQFQVIYTLIHIFLPPSKIQKHKERSKRDRKEVNELENPYTSHTYES